MPDVVLTAGLDTTEVTAAMRKLQVDSGLLQQQIDRATNPLNHETRRLSESMQEVSHGIRGAARQFHHLVFAPIMIAGIAYEFFHLGNEIEEMWHKSFEGGAERAASFINALDFSKPTESLIKLQEELDKLNAKISSGGTLKDQAQSAFGSLVTGTFMFSGASTAADEEQKSHLLRAQETLQRGVETERERRFNRLSEELDIRQKLLSLELLSITGQERESAISRAKLDAEREILRIRRDGSLTAAQKSEAIARLEGMGNQAADIAGRRFDAKYSIHGVAEAGTIGAGLSPGLLGVLSSGSAAGTGEQSPVVKKVSKVIEKLDYVGKTLQLIHEDFMRSGGNGPAPGLR